MPKLVRGLTFTCKYTVDAASKYQDGKLFLGILGAEYSIPYKNYINGAARTEDVMTLTSSSISPKDLFYSYINRTADQEEFAYSDGVLPVYLRYQPDLREPLDDAAKQVPPGDDYMAQALQLEQPTVIVSGDEEIVRADGSRSFQNRDVHFVVPINPPSKRIVTLSSELGLLVFLARVR